MIPTFCFVGSRGLTLSHVHQARRCTWERIRQFSQTSRSLESCGSGRWGPGSSVQLAFQRPRLTARAPPTRPAQGCARPPSGSTARATLAPPRQGSAPALRVRTTADPRTCSGSHRRRKSSISSPRTRTRTPGPSGHPLQEDHHDHPPSLHPPDRHARRRPPPAPGAPKRMMAFMRPFPWLSGGRADGPCGGSRRSGG